MTVVNRLTLAVLVLLSISLCLIFTIGAEDISTVHKVNWCVHVYVKKSYIGCLLSGGGCIYGGAGGLRSWKCSPRCGPNKKRNDDTSEVEN